MGLKFPEIPRPHYVVHLHYLEHFGASDYIQFIYFFSQIKYKYLLDFFNFILKWMFLFYIL